MMSNEAAVTLANAIVRQAGKDYLDARLKLSRAKDERQKKKALAMIEDVAGFVGSEWYDTLTNLDASYLMKRLREEAAG